MAADTGRAEPPFVTGMCVASVGVVGKGPERNAPQTARSLCVGASDQMGSRRRCGGEEGVGRRSREALGGLLRKRGGLLVASWKVCIRLAR